MSSPDVLIIGAGPAGTAAAITLARAGRSVLIADKATFPRDKCCGDGLTTGALRLLERLGFAPTMVPNWQPIDAAWVRSPSGREVGFPFPSDRGLFGAVAPRRELDATLVELAVAAGADVRQGHGLTEITNTASGLEATIDGIGVVRPGFIIAADGMWSPTRKLLGLSTEGYLGEWHAFRQYADNVTGSATERLWVWFEPDLLPGYAWSFPLQGNRANVGFGILRDGVRKISDMKALWPELLQRPHIAAALGPDVTWPERHTAWPIPARIDKAVLGRDRVLFVGDAAAATDTLTGEGIGQALLTGILAAEAVIGHTVAGGPRITDVEAAAHRAVADAPDRAGVDAVADAAAVQADYARAVRHHLLADHRFSHLLGRALAHERGVRGSVVVAGATDWTRRNFARWLFEDEPRAILGTPRRWHRHFLDRPGAFH